jgi:hypothetical protein
MSNTTFKVNNLIANNTVYNTGNQIISGTKTFNSVIRGNISTLRTGSRGFSDTYPNQVATWDGYDKSFAPAEDGLFILHWHGGASAEKQIQWDTYLNNDSEDIIINQPYIGRDLQITAQGGFFGGSILNVQASVSLTRTNLSLGTVDYFHGLYSEDFLVSHKDSTYTTFSPLYINNAANTVNVVNAVVDQTTAKPTAGWVSLVTAGDSLYLRFRGHTLADNPGVTEYETHIKVYLKNHE